MGRCRYAFVQAAVILARVILQPLGIDLMYRNSSSEVSSYTVLDAVVPAVSIRQSHNIHKPIFAEME